MAKKPGRRARIWCHTPLMHWMCNCYRSEILAGEKVEGLCTCDCHAFAAFKSTYNLDPIMGQVIGGERYAQAQLISLQLDKDASCSEVQVLLERRLAEVKAKLADLACVRDALTSALAECRRSRRGCRVLADLRHGRQVRRAK